MSLAAAAARDTADLTLYAVAAPVLVVLLLTGALGEARALREAAATAGLTKWERASIVAFAFVCFVVFIGVGACLVAITGGSPGTAEQVIVVASVATAILSVTLIGLLPALALVMDAKARLRALRVAITSVLGVGVVIGSYAVREAARVTPRESYRVYGTCAVGRCGLNERERPTPESRRRRQWRDGQVVEIVCQTTGARLTAPSGVSSNVWDKLQTGGYVSDLHVDTPRVGDYSSGIPACAGSGARRTPTG